MSIVFEARIEEIEKLSSKQQAAVGLICQGLSGQEVAAKLRINAATLSRWQDIKAFRDAVRKTRDLIFQQTVGILVNESVDAAKTLALIMKQRESKRDGGLQLSAAKSVLEYAINTRQGEDLEVRIEMLEAVIAASAQTTEGG